MTKDILIAISSDYDGTTIHGVYSLDSIEVAKEKLMDHHRQWHGRSQNYRVERHLVNDNTLTETVWYLDRQTCDCDSCSQARRDRAEYERLKRKFG